MRKTIDGGNLFTNRRYCTSSETHEITVTFQTTSSNAYRLINVFAADTTSYRPATGATITYTFTLGPGQGKLLEFGRP